MEDIPVYNCIQILCLLLNGKISVNNIVKQTSIYKNNVFDVNKILEKAGLANSTVDERIHKQMKFMELTEFGRELAGIIQRAYEFEKPYLEYQKKIKESFIVVENTDEKVRKRKLLDKGWKNEEINNYYEEWLERASYFEREILSMLIEGVTIRYALLLLRFNPNKIAKEILIKAVINILTKYLLVRLENLVDNELFKCVYCGANFPKKDIAKHRVSEMAEDFGIDVFDFIDDFAASLINSRFINEELKNVITSFFSVIQLPKKSIIKHIKQEEEILNEADAKLPNNENNENYNQVLSLYKELIK